MLWQHLPSIHVIFNKYPVIHDSEKWENNGTEKISVDVP